VGSYCVHIFLSKQLLYQEIIFCTGKLALGVPVNRILDDVQSSDIEGGLKEFIY
jgi:hypothetical protein